MNKHKKPSMLNILRQNLLIFVSIAGIILSIKFTYATGTEIKAPEVSLRTPPTSPYEHTISGIGFVESSSRNINVGAFSAGIVTDVRVTENESVNIDDILFIQDQRSALAEVQNRQDALAVAQSALELAKIEFDDMQDKLTRAKGLKAGRTISIEDLKSKHFATEKAKANVRIKETMITQSRTALHLAEITLEKTIVRSPIEGIVLKVRVTPGEFISGNEQDIDSPILVGKTHPLYVRVQIDENDIWRFDKDLEAKAYLRSNTTIELPLVFIRIDPYALGKEQLKGIGSELVDTRIIEIVYKIDKEVENLYIGQQLDIFIESKNSP